MKVLLLINKMKKKDIIDKVIEDNKLRREAITKYNERLIDIIQELYDSGANPDIIRKLKLVGIDCMF